MRYTGNVRKINYESTHSFFESRGRDASSDNPEASTMYQKGDLSTRRDLWEKDIVIPLLDLKGDDQIMDIGCGYGRWATALKGYYKYYLGIDFSSELLKIAEQRLQSDNVYFQCMPAQCISPKTVLYEGSFDLFICSGILIYLNDDDVEKLSQAIVCFASANSRVYLREPMAITGSRLTLDCFHSEELDMEYSAVYRTPEECYKLFGEPLIKAGFECVVERSLYPKELCNRRETEQQIQIWSRNV